MGNSLLETILKAAENGEDIFHFTESEVMGIFATGCLVGCLLGSCCGFGSKGVIVVENRRRF